MKHLLISAIAAGAFATVAVPASAGGSKAGGHGISPAHVPAQQSGHIVLAGSKHCPPGLAKKHNGCNPPGQVKHRYGIGDRIYRDYDVIRRPGRYGLDPDESYFRVGNYVYRVDRDTREVLDLIGAVAAILD